MKGLPRPSRLYDAVVLGGDLAALAAGALLAKKGWRILLVEDGSHAVHRTLGQHRLPRAPQLLPPVKAVPAFHALLDALGLLPTVGRSVEPYPRGLQVVLPGARFDLFPDPKKRRAELARALGSPDAFPEHYGPDLQVWEGLSVHLPPAGLRDRWALRRLRPWTEPMQWESLAPLAPALEALQGLCGGPSRLDFARASLPLLSQPSRLPQKRLEEVLRQAITAHRGDVLGSAEKPATIEGLVVEGGAFAGVQLAGQAEPYRGRIGLAGMEPQRVAELLPPSRRQRKLQATAAKLVAERRLFGLQLLLAKAALPPAVAELVLVAGGEGPAALLGVEAAQRVDGAPDDEVFGLSAIAAVPADWTEERALAGVVERVEEVFPFHGRHVLQRAGGPLGWAGVRREPADPLGLGAPLRTPVRGLFLASSWVLPTLGFEGALLAGLRTAESAQALKSKIR